MTRAARFKIPDRDPNRPKAFEAAAAISAYYRKPGNAAGGALHLVLDDGNLDDADITYCRSYAVERDDADGVRIADMMLAMTRSQRKRAIRLARAKCYATEGKR